MPNRPKLPTDPTLRIPKGLTRADYTDEALEAYDRNRWRKYQRGRRARLRHNGTIERSFTIAKAVDDALAAMAKATGTSKSRFIERLITEELERRAKPNRTE